MIGDGAFDAKPVLNTIASKGYIPIVRRGLASPGRIWSKDKRQSIR